MPDCDEDLFLGPEVTQVPPLAVVTGSMVQEATRELGFRKCPVQAPGEILRMGGGLVTGSTSK